MTGALSVDLAGLRLLVERRGKSFAILELISNAWDEAGVTNVHVTMDHVGRNRVKLVVTDDAPNGFADLTHAYTLFAASKKKGDPTTRGRFNLGEKLVIALADTFTVRTTTGGVTIDVERNTRAALRTKRYKGSEITAILRMTQDEMADALAAFHRMIPPPHIVTTINGVTLATREPIATLEATLQTERADADGFLRPTKRNTFVTVYEPAPGETAALYELGIPVVETGDAYHVNVWQKVPLNSDRDNVPPAFLRDVRTHVLNATVSMLSPDAVATGWVNEALEDELVTPGTVTAVLAARYGERRVVYDPSDHEANRIALSEGYSVIPSAAFSKTAWDAVRAAGAALPAGRVTPSPKPFSPDGRPLKVITVADYTDAQRRFVWAVAKLHGDLIGKPVSVMLADDAGWGFNGCYGDGQITINMATIAPGLSDANTLRFLLHEFAHHYGAHLTHAFDDAIAKIAAKLVLRVVDDPTYLARLGDV